MKLHLAERDPQHHAWPKRGVEGAGLRLRILLSYWYYKDVDLDALFAKYFSKPYPDVFADSGAFSAMTQGAHITTGEYGSWVKRWGHLFTTYSNLDVIKNAEATWHNQQELEDKLGLAPLPTFHVLEEMRWLEHYVKRYPYIALGVAGMQSRREGVMRWLVQCFKMAGKDAVFHGFALTSWLVMKSFPWYSVDSSSWGSGFRYGQVLVWDVVAGRFVEVRLGDKETARKYASQIRALGFEPLDFALRERNDRAKICAISALSYMLAEQWLRQRHGEIHIPHREGGAPGLALHLADANPARYGDIIAGAGVRLHLADTSNGVNFRDADAGVKLHLADARGHSAGDLASAMTGMNVYLADKTLTESIAGDIPRAMEILDRGQEDRLQD